MFNLEPFLWGLAILCVGLLNIAGILPDWTTITAILTLPFFAVATGRTCRPALKGRAK